MNSEIEYRLGHSVEQIVSTPGGIERLSVGVLVPTSAVEEQLKQIEDLVAMAVGLDLKRGDAIAVHAAASGILPGGELDILLEPQLSHSASKPVVKDSMSDAVEEFNPISIDNLPTIEQLPENNVSTSKLPNWLSNYWAEHSEKSILIVVGLFLMLVVLIGAIMMGRRKHKIDESRMLTSERERVLGQLKTWLSADEFSHRKEGEAT